MRIITIKCFDNGKTTLTNTDFHFSGENKASKVIIDFSETTNKGYYKFLDIELPDNTYKRCDLGTSEIVEQELENEVTMSGRITFAPFMVESLTVDARKLEFHPQSITVRKQITATDGVGEPNKDIWFEFTGDINSRQYEVELRQDSVENSLEEFINDQVEKGVIATDIENKLYAKEQEYAPRLNSLENNKADKIALAAVASGSPKGVYSSLSELTADNPDPAYTYITANNGHWNYYNTNAGTWVSGGIYQAANNPEVTDARVSSAKNKTFVTLRSRLEDTEDDLNNLQLSLPYLKNELYNPQFNDGLDNWENIGATTVVDNTVIMSPVSTTFIKQSFSTNIGDKIYVKTLVKIEKSGGTSTSFVRVYNQSNAIKISSQVKEGSLGIWQNVSAIGTIDTDSAYVHINANGSSPIVHLKNVYIVNLTKTFGAGNEPSKEELDLLTEENTNYVQNTIMYYDVKKAFSDIDALSSKSIITDKVVEQFVKIQNIIKNGDFLTDLSHWTDVGAVFFENGYMKIAPSSNTWATQTFEASIGDKIYASSLIKIEKSGGVNSAYLRIYSGSTQVMSYNIPENTLGNWALASGIGESISTSMDIRFFVLGSSPIVLVDNVVAINLTKTFGAGNEPSKEELDRFISAQNYYFTDTYYYNIKNVQLRLDVVEEEVQSANLISENQKFYLTDSFEGMFKTLERSYTDYELTHLLLKHTDIYQMYDNLKTLFPEYITCEVMDSIDTNSGLLEIRRYKFKPAQTRDGIDKLPKIIIVAGHHGNEKMGQISTFNMIYDICNNWKADDKLRYLRHNIEFYIFPCLNVWGVDNNSRTNYNGVDLNRNYPNNWVLTSEGNTYSGSEPLSEIETQCVQNTIDDNLDTILFIDFHNYSIPPLPTDCIWVSSPTNKAKILGTNFIRTISNFWKTNYSEVLQDDVVFGYVDGGSYGNGTAASNADNSGVFGQTLEVGEKFPNIVGTVKYDIVSQKRHQEVITNFVLQHIKKLVY